MYNNDKCCCTEYLEKDTKLELSFENEVYSIYGNLNNKERIILKYYGKLMPCDNLDDKKIFLNYGYGNLWIDKTVVEMDLCRHNEKKCYCHELELVNVENLFFCFMDSENNWDLNNNSSYMITIDSPLTTLTKKTFAVEVAEEEYLSERSKIFKKISDKIINFFMKIGNLFDKKIRT